MAPVMHIKLIQLSGTYFNRGKGFGFHTPEFNKGYVDGFCANSPSGTGSDANQATFHCPSNTNAGGNAVPQSSQQGEPAHCDIAGYPSCYSIGYSAGQSNLGSGCPSGPSTNYCNGWNACANGNTGSSSSSSSSSSSTSGGTPHHTAGYWYGYTIGQEDGRAGVFDIGSSCDNAPDHNFQHSAAGYSEGYKSICGNLNTRSNVSC